MNRTVPIPHNISPGLTTALQNLGTQISDKERREMRLQLNVQQMVMVTELDRACRLETEIEEMVDDLADAQNDWHEGSLTRALDLKRAEYTAAVKAAGAAMGTVADLRERLGMKVHPMVAIQATGAKS